MFTLAPHFLIQNSSDEWTGSSDQVRVSFDGAVFAFEFDVGEIVVGQIFRTKEIDPVVDKMVRIHLQLDWVFSVARYCEKECKYLQLEYH
jgi:hypothetical protein